MKQGKPLPRKTPLKAGQPLPRKTPLKVKPQPPKARSTLPRPTQPINPVSDKRRTENAERRKMLAEKTGGEPVLCERCRCRWANDGHEVLSRGRGGSITDPDNVVTICRDCHTFITREPVIAEAEGWSLPSPVRKRVERAS